MLVQEALFGLRGRLRLSFLVWGGFPDLWGLFGESFWALGASLAFGAALGVAC